MAEVTVYDAIRMKAIEDASVVNGEIDPVTGHLMLTRFDATEIDAGLVVTSPKVVTSGTRPTGGALFDGLLIYETDTKRYWYYNGTAWIYLNGPWVCTSSTRPATPPTGMEIFETDTGRKLIRTPAGNWARIAHTKGSGITGGVWTKSQSIASASAVAVTGYTEVTDSDGFYSSGANIVIPAGMAGVYSIAASDTSPTGPYTRRFLDLTANGITYRSAGANEGFLNNTPVVYLPVGATISLVSWQDAGSAKTLTFRIELTMIQHIPDA